MHSGLIVFPVKVGLVANFFTPTVMRTVKDSKNTRSLGRAESAQPWDESLYVTVLSSPTQGLASTCF